MLANSLCSGTGNFPDQIRVSANIKTKLIKCKDLTWIARSEMKMIAKAVHKIYLLVQVKSVAAVLKNIDKAQTHFCGGP